MPSLLGFVGLSCTLCAAANAARAPGVDTNIHSDPAPSTPRVQVYQYMRLLGYPANRISVLTTYNGQKALLRDVFERRCVRHPAFGRPAIVTTVDKFQGNQVRQRAWLSYCCCLAFSW